MDNNKSHNPQQHLSMLARTLLESFQGDENRTVRTLQRLSRCKNVKTVRFFLKNVGVYPGEPGNIPKVTLQSVFDYFRDHQEDLRFIDSEIQNITEIEASYVFDRSRENEDVYLPTQKVNW
jgi:hypothetical protein